MKTLLRRATVSTVTGALLVSVAWAGASLAPVDEVTETTEVADDNRRDAPKTGDVPTATAASDPLNLLEAGGASLPKGKLQRGLYHVGAAKVSLEPQPEAYGGTWEQDETKCETLSGNFFNDVPSNASHVANAGSPWPENPNCIYAGGYGIGPMNALVEFDDEYGLWARTVAISDGEDPVFLTVIDAEGWFWDYASKCDDCGFKQIGARLAAELGTDQSAFIFHSTHSHTAMDFIGGWGFVPDWYMEQATDAIEESVRRAVDSMRVARIEIGEVEARQFNHERRDTYRAAEEQQLTWLRAYAPGRQEVIATIGTYAAHPTTLDVGPGVAHGDWPVVFESRLEERFGGIGFHFMTGLGNMSVGFPAHERHEGEEGVDMGRALADLVPPVGEGRQIGLTDIETAQETWNQPVTNVPLTALGMPGFFDRQFNHTPAAITIGPRVAPEVPDEDGGAISDPVNEATGQVGNCTSASPVSVEVVANAARIGEDLFITSGPGELFSNLTNVIKEKAKEDHRGALAMPLAQANDALGYILQSFEAAANPASGQGAGFADSGPAYIEYEDAYSIDRCFGDMVLETTLRSLLPAVAD
ncbi:MAG: hypothetical protein R3320_11625 [Nitriliruptorales bacterium]|nr:hypothetical protein [Nitriliruptorales bacterium]